MVRCHWCNVLLYNNKFERFGKFKVWIKVEGHYGASHRTSKLSPVWSCKKCRNKYLQSLKSIMQKKE